MTLKAAQRLSWKILPWRKKALLTIQDYAHPGRKGSWITWREGKGPEYLAVWGCGRDFYQARWTDYPTCDSRDVCLITLERDSAGGWQNIRGSDRRLVLTLKPGP